ncbi:MAG TPA: peptidoglycan bridge formation glycyltransferase FemA/FemB family protein [Candidatus Dormibacteraeota bacterium]|jgi:lipid II:glycine glycyltransferase (peptidoglycan interpeptide bridge formation enzyme)|nr:peptidoglycan bridge formation glycyltransferase FemA/FemB family protein [Candidatus Dormibacteraeota bacterium]
MTLERPRGLDAAPPPADAWDRALAVWPHAHLLQSHGWGAVQASVGWRVHRLRVDAGGGRTLPVTALSAPVIPGAPPRLYVPRGPACAPGDAAAWAAAVAALEALAARLGAVSVTVEPSAGAGDAAEIAGRLGPAWAVVEAVQPAHTAIVDLSGGVDAVLTRMRPKGRYNVRLAERRGVTVETPEDRPLAAARLSRLCAATERRQGIVLPSASHLRLVLAALPGSSIQLASVEGEVVSGALTVPFAGEAIYLYGGSSAQHRDRQPSALVQFASMRAALDAGCSRYDLWGIPPDADAGHPWHGLRQFKLNLGGVERVAAGAWRWDRRPLAVRALAGAEAARLRARRLRRRLQRGAGA